MVRNIERIECAEPAEQYSRGRFLPQSAVVRGLGLDLRISAVLACVLAALLGGAACGPSHKTLPAPRGVCWNAVCRTFHFSLSSQDYLKSIGFTLENPSNKDVNVPQGTLLVVVQQQVDGGCRVVATFPKVVQEHVLKPGENDRYAFTWSSHPDGTFWVNVFFSGVGSALPLPDATMVSSPPTSVVPPTTACVAPPMSQVLKK